MTPPKPAALTFDWIKSWGPWFWGAVMVIVAVVLAYGQAKADMKALSVRVDTVESSHRSDHDMLERVDRRVGLLVCKLDSEHCDP